MKYSWLSYALAALVLTISCKTVPLTGREQLNMVPNSIITAMSFTAYDSLVKISPVLSQNDERAQLVDFYEYGRI